MLLVPEPVAPDSVLTKTRRKYRHYALVWYAPPGGMPMMTWIARALMSVLLRNNSGSGGSWDKRWKEAVLWSPKKDRGPVPDPPRFTLPAFRYHLSYHTASTLRAMSRTSTNISVMEGVDSGTWKCAIGAANVQLTVPTGVWQLPHIHPDACTQGPESLGGYHYPGIQSSEDARAHHWCVFPSILPVGSLVQARSSPAPI